MDDITTRVIVTVFCAIASGAIGYLWWKVRKSETGREEFIVLRTEFKRMKEDWKEKNVDKAYDSAKRCHERVDKIET